jgi:hypothetical protein
MPVAHGDKVDAEILPDPELNPLLNPLLAAHMGRWAEVYFTSPPDKRGQAVSDLVRELRSGPPPESSAVQANIDKAGKTEGTKQPKPLSDEAHYQRQAPPAVEARRTCNVCSAESPAEQKFCGMCGAPLQSSPQKDVSKFQLNAPASEIASALETSEEENWNETQSSSKPGSSVVSYSTEYAPEPSLSFGGYSRGDSHQREWSMPETDLPSFAVESESVHYRYRLYIGIAVALVLGGLLYMAWHGTPGSSGDSSDSVPSRVIPAAPSRATPATAQEPASKQSVPPKDATAAAPAHTPPAAAASSDANQTSRARSVENQNQPATGSRPTQAAARERTPSPRIVSVAANSSVGATESSGAEELATAEKYLNRGHQGGAKDNGEAAQWLWRAVGKGNLAATMVLSDLYLRGDGIPKSCDQARLLLDVAARKGKTSAGERLRNLQAFGCQ